MKAMATSALRRVIACGVVALVAIAGHWLLATVMGFVLGGLYWYSVRRMPTVPCWLCGGSGGTAHWGLLGWLFPRAGGLCLRCHGDKVNLRWGARVVGGR
jgi:hypothetical protein